MSKGERSETSRPIIGFAGLMVVVLLMVLAIAGCGGGDDSGSDAHINTESGSTNEALPDEREGIPPPPAEGLTLAEAVEKGDCFLIRNAKEEGNGTLPPGSPSPEYKTDPPTSGDHVEPPHQQADGAYLTMPEPMDVVAALNNGRVAIQYAPDLSQEIQREFKGLYDTMYAGTLLFPNDEMNWAAAATSWTNFIGCPGYKGKPTLEAIRAFAKKTWGRYGHKPVDSFPLDGPTPVEPDEPSE